MPDLTPILQRLDALEAKTANPKLNLDTDIYGMFEVVSAVPTLTPKTAYDQIKIYTNATTYRLYWYDWVNHAWHYATGT